MLAAAAIDLYRNPAELLKEARKEYEIRTKEGYTCPDPGGCRTGDSGLKLNAFARFTGHTGNRWQNRKKYAYDEGDPVQEEAALDGPF